MNAYNQSKKYIVVASIFAMIATLLSSYVVHLLKSKLTMYQLSIFQTGVFYQFIHSLALLGVGLTLTHFHSHLIKRAGNLFILGIILFSGSLYAISILQMRWIDFLTPIGGLSFIFGWLFLAIGVYKDVPESNTEQHE